MNGLGQVLSWRAKLPLGRIVGGRGSCRAASPFFPSVVGRDPSRATFTPTSRLGLRHGRIVGGRGPCRAATFDLYFSARREARPPAIRPINIDAALVSRGGHRVRSESDNAIRTARQGGGGTVGGSWKGWADGLPELCSSYAAGCIRN